MGAQCSDMSVCSKCSASKGEVAAAPGVDDRNRTGAQKFHARESKVVTNAAKLDNKYEVGKKVVGEGAYGTVRKAKNKTTGQVFAVKAIHKKLVKDIALLEHEIGLMKVLDHPNIVKLIETFEDKRSYYIVMELCVGGELFDRIVAKKNGFTEKTCAVLVQQMLRAGHYMHTNGVAHRDIKPENFLLAEDKDLMDATLKLVDFGLAKTVGKKDLKTKAGTPLYMAPEILKGEYDEKVDVWAIGVVMYILVCGAPPFAGKNDAEILNNVKRGAVSFDRKEWRNVSDMGKSLCLQLLTYERGSRPTAGQGLNHKWFEEMIALNEMQLTSLACDALQEFADASKFKRMALYVIATQMSESKISDLKNVFLSMDENSDGTLSVAEVKEGLKRAGFPDPEQLEGILASIDTDNSGVIDYSEFMAATLDRQRYMQEDVCWRAFRVFDKDGSGSISREELQNALTDGEVCEMLHYDASMIDDIVKEADTNGDGVIDFDEFFAMMLGDRVGQIRQGGDGDDYEDLVGVAPAAEPGGGNRSSFSMQTFISSNVGQLQGKYAVSKKVVGEGSYGTVKKCKNKATGAIRAIKTIHKKFVKDMKLLQNEIEVMKCLDHPNIVKLYETFEDKRSYYLIMELCGGGELFDRIIDEKGFTEKVCAVVVQQMLRAINYMHQNGFVHRDIKPENWLLLVNGPVASTALKMVDFGLSKSFDMKGASTLQTKAGTPMYMAPEVLKGKYNHLVDVWSIGIVMYIMLSGRPPFPGKDEATILKHVKKGEISLDAKPWEKVSAPTKDFLLLLVAPQPADRLDAHQALSHGWFKTMVAASEQSISTLAVDNLKSFATMGRLKKAALFVIATQLKDSQIDDLKRTFLSMDADQDGTLTAAEIKSGFRTAGIDPPAELEDLLKSIDTDGSGCVDYMEFIAATMDKQKYVQEDVCWSAFKVFDLDGNGTITKDEMSQVFANGSVTDALKMSPAEVQKLMEEADANGDGEIDFEEFMEMIQGGDGPKPRKKEKRDSKDSVVSKDSAGRRKNSKDAPASGRKSALAAKKK
jgi:calcium-dependent protein kinase